MGLFDLLTKEGRQKSARERNIARTASKHAQSPDRFAAMEKLREDGSEEALFGLMRRFSFKYDKSIEDEQEKEWVVEVLVSKGEAALPAVRRYAKGSDSWSWALKILGAICSGPKMLEVLTDLLAKEEPGYTRDPSRKLEALTFLGEWEGVPASQRAPLIVPYLADFDEGVRFQAVEALARTHDEASAKAPLLAALLRPEEESRRIKVRIAEVLAEAGWAVTERKEEVAVLLGAVLPGFKMHHDKLQQDQEKKGK